MLQRQRRLEDRGNSSCAFGVANYGLDAADEHVGIVIFADGPGHSVVFVTKKCSMDSLSLNGVTYLAC